MCHITGKKTNDLAGYALTVKKTIHSIENECNETKAIKEQCKTRLILEKKILKPADK